MAVLGGTALRAHFKRRGNLQRENVPSLHEFMMQLRKEFLTNSRVESETIRSDISALPFTAPSLAKPFFWKNNFTNRKIKWQEGSYERDFPQSSIHFFFIS